MPGASEQQEQALGSSPTSEPVPCPSPLPGCTSDKDEATIQATECSQEEGEVAETKVLPCNDTDLATQAAVAAAAPLRRDEALEKKEKAEAARNALLNPPRRPEHAAPTAGQAGFPQGQDASEYNSAALRFQDTLSTLQGKITKQSQGQISVEDLETIHDQFESFMNCHPIHSPAARRARALAAAASVNPINPTPPKRKPGRPPKPASVSVPAPEEALLAAGVGGYPVGMWRHDLARPPAIGSQWNLAHALQHFLPHGAIPTQITQGSDYSTVSTYAPYMSAIPAPSHADSAAIAIATAAAMAGNAHAGGGGGHFPPSAMDLLQVLSAAHIRDQHNKEQQEDPDELAASALISLGGNIPRRPPQKAARNVKRAAPTKASGGTDAASRRRRTSPGTSSKGRQPPPPEVPPSVVDSQVFALLMQSLGHHQA